MSKAKFLDLINPVIKNEKALNLYLEWLEETQQFELNIYSLLDLLEIRNDLIKEAFFFPYFYLNHMSNRGSTCFEVSGKEFYQHLNQFFSATEAKAWQNKLIKSFLSENYAGIVSNKLNDYCPFLLVKSPDKQFLYTHRLFHAESNLKENLEILRLEKSVSRSQSEMNSIDLKVDGLNEEQIQAVKNALDFQLSIITGGPGTGKTHVVRAIILNLLSNGISSSQIALAAPTGKASFRLQEGVLDLFNDEQKMEAMTLHRLLKISSLKMSSRYSKENPLPYQVLIIDESSMIDVYLMNTLLSSLDLQKTKIIFVGDKNQLPSVEAGNVFADLFPKVAKNSITVLNKVYRAKSELTNYYQKILDGDQFELSQIDQLEDCFLSNNHLVQYDPTKEGRMNIDQMMRAYSHLLFDGKKVLTPTIAFEMFQKNKILCVLNKGPFGVDHINQICFAEACRQQGLTPDSVDILEGMPIQILSNMHDVQLYNGDVGICFKKEGSWMVLFKRGQEYQEHYLSHISHYQLAYAITIHKSQGSEYEQIVLVLPEEHKGGLLNRQLIYTAISRAKNKCLVIGSSEVWQQAVNHLDKRTTGF